MEKEIILVSEDGCPFCYETKNLLKKKGVQYNEITPEEYNKLYKEKIHSVPLTCLIEEGIKKCIIGFNKEELDKL